MKKIISAVMIFVFILSLCSCGGSSPEENAEPMNFSLMKEEFDKNKVNAEKQFLNKNYTLTGVVIEILNEKEIKLMPVDIAFSYGTKMRPVCVAELPEEEISKLSVNKMINIAGLLTEFSAENEFYNFKIADGAVTGDVVVCSGRVTSFHYFGSNMKEPYAQISVEIKTGENTNINKFDIKLPETKGAEKITEAEIMGVTVKELDSVTFKAKCSYNYEYGSRNYIVDELIEFTKN